MKALLILLSLLVIGCAQGKDFDFEFKDGACSGEPQIGKWANGTDELYISGDCRGATKFCALEFNYTAPFQFGSLTVVTVSQSTGWSGCLSTGIHSCNFSLQMGNPNYMQVMCDALPPVYYDRQPIN